MQKRRSYNWESIRAEYVTGDMSLRQLARDHDMPFSTLKKHLETHDFAKERDAYRRRVAQKATEDAERRDVAALSRLMTATERATDIVGDAMTNDTIYGYLSTKLAENDEETGEKKPGGLTITKLPKADTRAIVNLTSAIKNLALTIKTINPDATAADGQQNGVVIIPNRLSEEEENAE